MEKLNHYTQLNQIHSIMTLIISRKRVRFQIKQIIDFKILKRVSLRFRKQPQQQ